MHWWTATDARPGLPWVARAAINAANSLKVSTCSWLLWGPRSCFQSSLPNGFLCMSIPDVATQLSITHRTHDWRPISLRHFAALMSVMICWAIGRMIASSDIINWCNTYQIVACVCLRLNQWTSCSLNKSVWKLIMYFLKTTLCWDGLSCTQRCRIKVPSLDSPPTLWYFCLNVSIHTSLRSGRLAVVWWILLMLIRSPSCVIASYHKTRSRALCSIAFFSRGLCQFTKSTFGRNT